MLVKQFLDALVSIEQDSQRTNSLRSVANARKWLARLLWVRIMATKSNSSQGHDSKITKSGAFESHGVQPSSGVPPNFFERYFKGALYKDFVRRLRLSLCCSFLQAAIYDQDIPTMRLLLEQREDPKPSKISPCSSLQSLFTRSSSPSATDLEAEQPFELDSLYYDEEGGHSHMIVCGWEIPTFLSLPILSLLGKESHGFHDLIQSYKGKAGTWTDKVTDDIWHAILSVVVEKVYNMVVLTGNVDSARAATCRDIVNESCGDGLGLAVLRDLIYAASNSTRSFTPTISCSYAHCF